MTDEDDEREDSGEDEEYESDDEHEPAQPAEPAPSPSPATTMEARRATAERHFRFGWWGVVLFAGLGLVLEGLNGLRSDYYVNVANETRRHMFTLAHAHGTLLSVVNLVFAATLTSSFGERLQNIKVPSACLLAAMILLPAGFFTGGLVIYDGDPGLGITMVPVGALLLIAGSFLIARR